MATYVELLAATRASLVKAKKGTKPLDPEMRALFAEKMPEALAECDAKVAELAATIPGLIETLATLEARACGRCNGHGVYSGRSNYTNRDGQKVCFSCHGRGCRN